MSKSLTGRRIEIAWPDLDITVTAELDDRNTVLADALWESLPYESLQGHALVAGYHLYHAAPIPSLLHLHGSTRIDRREAPDGTVFCSALQHLGIKYGTLTEPMPASPVGQIREEDLPALNEAGRAVWDAVYSTKKPIPAEVRRAGEPGGHRVPRLAATDADAKQLIADVHVERIVRRQPERYGVHPPASRPPLRVRSGVLRSGPARRPQPEKPSATSSPASSPEQKGNRP